MANLPYGIAAGAILRTIEELDGVTRWVAMVQREVGERLAAAPGSGAYGVPSVLAQLACDVRVHRAVSRSVFHPVPNVDSVLVVLERTGPAAPPALRALVQAAFAHRRKALARSLALSPAVRRRRPRPRPRGARRPRPPRRRARRAAVARRLPRAGGGAQVTAALRDDAPAKINLCLFLGPTRREDGRHELVTVFQALALADRVDARAGALGARADEVVCPGVDGPPEATSPRRRCAPSARGPAGTAPPVRLRIDKRIPVAAGLAGGSADAGAALRLAARAAGIDDDALLLEVADAARRRRPRPGPPGPPPGAPAPASASSRCPRPRPYGVVLLPAGEALPTGRRLPRGRPPRPAAHAAATSPTASPRSAPPAPTCPDT